MNIFNQVIESMASNISDARQQGGVVAIDFFKGSGLPEDIKVNRIPQFVFAISIRCNLTLYSLGRCVQDKDTLLACLGDDDWSIFIKFDLKNAATHVDSFIERIEEMLEVSDDADEKWMDDDLFRKELEGFDHDFWRDK